MASTIDTVGIVSPGDMGSGVGRAFAQAGFTVLTDLQGRSESSRRRAGAAGMQDAGSLAGVMARADVVLSILPPASAVAFAEQAAAAMREAGRCPLFVDCNAISPFTMKAVAHTVMAAGADVVDAGIIGLAPGVAQPTRFYVAGARAEVLEALALPTFLVKQLGPEIGRASAMKMLYSGLNKGYNALQAAGCIAAMRAGLFDELVAELSFSQKAALDRMNNSVGFLAADSERWFPEMTEIAETFGALGVSSKFHEAAEETFRLLAETPLAAETRETWDRSRPLKTSVEIYAETIAAKERRRAAE